MIRNSGVRYNESGQVLMLLVLCLVALLGFAALVVDLGYVFYAHERLVAATQAAALAGSAVLPDSAAVTVAKQYAAASGDANNFPNMTITNVSAVTHCQIHQPGGLVAELCRSHLPQLHYGDGNRDRTNVFRQDLRGSFRRRIRNRNRPGQRRIAPPLRRHGNPRRNELDELDSRLKLYRPGDYREERTHGRAMRAVRDSAIAGPA